MQPPEVWDGGVGFVSKEMIQEHCPAPASDIQVDIELCLSKLIRTLWKVVIDNFFSLNLSVNL